MTVGDKTLASLVTSVDIVSFGFIPSIRASLLERNTLYVLRGTDSDSTSESVPAESLGIVLI